MQTRKHFIYNNITRKFWYSQAFVALCQGNMNICSSKQREYFRFSHGKKFSLD